jgi:transposase-like protein
VEFCDNNPEMNYNEIGRVFNIYAQNITRWYKEIKGYPRNNYVQERKVYTLSEKLAIVDYMKLNPEESYNSIALRFGVNRHNLMNWFKEYHGKTRQELTKVKNTVLNRYPVSLKKKKRLPDSVKQIQPIQ